MNIRSLWNVTMNPRLRELAELAGGFPLDGHGDNTLAFRERALERFARMVVAELVSRMQVEGSDFYYNEYNDYGSITVQHFVEGDARAMAGDEVFAQFHNGYRETGRYRLNDKFVEHLMNQCFGNTE